MWLRTVNIGCSRESDTANREKSGPSSAVPRTKLSVVEGLLNYSHTNRSMPFSWIRSIYMHPCVDDGCLHMAEIVLELHGEYGIY
jgi:hypothetical protein